MEEFANALNYAIPGFGLLIIIEFVWGRLKGVETIRIMDVVSSLSSGLTNILKTVLQLSIAVISYDWLVSHLGIWDLELSFLSVSICFIGLDFGGYWQHRLQHSINIFWNDHIIHHSSEEFNLACALRQSISIIISIYAIFLLPLAIIGIPTKIMGTVAAIHLFSQFWYHTKLINKMGVLEYIIVTPSHHRVHHAINSEYLDKNFGQIFIIWDKIFGTFQKELDEVSPVFGIKRAAKTWNPFIIGFQHLFLLIKDAWRAERIIDKFQIWFKPTGWRPEGFDEKYPVSSISDVYKQEKYAPKTGLGLKIWSSIQLSIQLLLILFLFNQLGNFGQTEKLQYGAFIFLSIFSYTSLMDLKNWAWIPEIFKLGFGFFLIRENGGWFGLDNFLPFGTETMGFYLILSFGLTIYFLFIESSTEPGNKVEII